jgi:hypothetical protein
MAAEITVTQDTLWAEKDKDATRQYTFKLNDFMADDDKIVSANWSVSPTGAVTAQSSTFTDKAVAVTVAGGVSQAWYALTCSWSSQNGVVDQFTMRLFIKEDRETVLSLGSALFPNRFTAVKKLRTDRLMLAATASMPSVELSDDYLWDKLRAAESEIGHTLRVPLGPTTFFPEQPTQDQITALNGGAWAIDPGYDYDPQAFGYGDKWGMLKLKNKPLISVSRVRFAYPGGSGSSYDLPLDWLRMDRKYGTVQFVPSSTAFVAPLNAFVMQAIGNGRVIPLAIQVTYVAGLANAAADYPELLDVVMKKASLKILEDAFLPQSGSISADGLSQSMSTDMEKHHDIIDRILNGGKGSNGGLMTAIHGVRLAVLGA